MKKLIAALTVLAFTCCFLCSCVEGDVLVSFSEEGVEVSLFEKEETQIYEIESETVEEKTTPIKNVILIIGDGTG